MNAIVQAIKPITVQLITDEKKRLLMFPLLFGTRSGLMFEYHVYNMAEALCPTYRGGFWEFNRLSNGGFFLCLAGDEPIEIRAMNGTHGTVSRETVGIILSLFSYKIMMERDRKPYKFQCHFQWLCEYVFSHDDGAFIFSAIN